MLLTVLLLGHFVPHLILAISFSPWNHNATYGKSCQTSSVLAISQLGVSHSIAVFCGMLKFFGPRLFGAGGTQGGVKKITTAKLTYDRWWLKPNTRELVNTIHHPLVTEYFVRLDQKRKAIDQWLETNTGIPEKDQQPLVNKVDGSPFNMVMWNSHYRDEVDLGEKMTQLLTQLDENVMMRDQLEGKDSAKLSESDAELLEMVKDEITTLLEKIKELDPEVDTVMNRRLSSEDVIGSSSNTWNITVTGKAGGEEAGLFAGELAEMFKAYAKESRAMTVCDLDGSEVGNDSTEGSTAGGFRFQVSGMNVYRNFHHEIGVHKVQRVPVTDAAGKMQTSTAVFTMMPVLDPVSVDVLESDCKIDFVRGSGPGGQGMQSSSNCCVLTHKPSGISVKCHQSRSALGNKELALQMVAQQILAQKVRDQNSSLYDAWKNQWSSGERSDKMRTYNYPQNRVTDHRLGKDYPLISFMEHGSGLVKVHDELNEVNDREQLNSALLRHIEGEFGSTV